MFETGASFTVCIGGSLNSHKFWNNSRGLEEISIKAGIRERVGFFSSLSPLIFHDLERVEWSVITRVLTLGNQFLTCVLMFKENKVEQDADFFGISSSMFCFSEFLGPCFSVLSAASEQISSVSPGHMGNPYVYEVVHSFGGVLYQLVFWWSLLLS